MYTKNDIARTNMELQTFYTVIVFTACFVMLSLSLATVFNPLIKKKQKINFAVLFISIILINIGEWFADVVEGGAAVAVFLRIARFVEYSLAPVAAISAVNALGYSKKHIKIAVIPIAVNIILQIVSIPTGAVFSIEPIAEGSAVYHAVRGFLYPLYAVITAGSLLYMLAHCIAYSVRYQFRDIGLLVCICVMVVFAFITQVVWTNFNLGWVCGAFSVLMLYVYYEELIHQIDPLTGLLNRGGFDSQIAKIKQPAWIIFFDVDRFKNINDVYGHAYGDECLRVIGRNVKTYFGEWGYCFRYGGDEFCAVITRNDLDPRTLLVAYENRLAVLRKEDPRLPGISAGFSRFDPAKEAYDEAVFRADEMMYREKDVHHAAMDKEIADKK